MKTACRFNHLERLRFPKTTAERFETNKAVNPLKVFDGLVISWSRRRRNGSPPDRA